MNQYFRKWTAGLLAAGCLLTGSLTALAAEPAAEIQQKYTFAFESMDLDGNPVNEEIFKRHALTMVNIWGTYCGYCLDEMPALGELAKEYADKGVQIVGIVADVEQKKDGTYSDKMVKEAKELVQATGADYLHIRASQGLLTGILRGVPGIPLTFFVDGEGNLLEGSVVVGSQSKEVWGAIFDEVLSWVQAVEE